MDRRRGGYRPRVHVRHERPEDRAAVAAVVTAAFGDDGMVARLVADLRDLLSDRVGTALVAEEGNELVGVVLCTASRLDTPRQLLDVPVLSPLGVAPPHQGCGVGRALVTAAVDEVERQGAPAVFLEGDPRYYGRFGFVAAGPLGFRKPSLRIPDAGFQVRLLDGYEPWMTGTLVYAEAFWAHNAVGPPDDLA
jgi:putative acetyltransferase